MTSLIQTYTATQDLYALAVYISADYWMCSMAETVNQACIEIDTKLTRKSVAPFYSFYCIKAEYTYVFNAFRLM